MNNMSKLNKIRVNYQIQYKEIIVNYQIECKKIIQI